MQNSILTITQLNYAVRNMLEGEFGQIWLTGEISNLSKPVSGHWYLTLKDEQAQVRCAMFRMKNMRVNFPVQNGMQVLVRAGVSLYEPRGDYQVIIESMQPAGDGLLQQQFEQLKLKLAAEGLFAQSAKKPLPDFVKTVGIITSSSGAALQDILQILHRRDPSLNVIIYPTLVQGREATQEIVQMIELANARKECDVLIVGRGGGSLEDLWCFNEEAVAYAIFRSSLPIISAVGHETDVTIADFVADLRAPTPSAAAELVSRDSQELVRRLQQQRDRAGFAFDRIWSEKKGKFDRLQLRLNAHHPARQLAQQRQILSQKAQQLHRAIRYYLTASTADFSRLQARLTSTHPKHQIGLQYERLNACATQLDKQIVRYISLKRQTWQQWAQRVEKSPFPYQIGSWQYQTVQLQQRLHFAMQSALRQYTQQFQSLCVKLDGLSPLQILTRGYSVTKNSQGRVVTESGEVEVGETLTTRLAKGEITSRIVGIK